MNVTATSTRRARVGILWGPALASFAGRDQKTFEREEGMERNQSMRAGNLKLKARSTGAQFLTGIAGQESGQLASCGKPSRPAHKTSIGCRTGTQRRLASYGMRQRPRREKPRSRRGAMRRRQRQDRPQPGWHLVGVHWHPVGNRKPVFSGKIEIRQTVTTSMHWHLVEQTIRITNTLLQSPQDASSTAAENQ